MSSTRSVLKHVCEIIQAELGLTEGQVYLYNQKINLPPSSGLWVCVGITSLKPYGSKTVMDPSGNQLQVLNVQALLSIDVMSQDTSAIEMRDEVVMALGSFLSQNTQARHGFHLAKLPLSVVDISEIEGAAIPYRFNISVQAQYAITRVKPTPYYATFPQPTIGTEP